MPPFLVPLVTTNSTGWGPSADSIDENSPGNISRFADLPYSPFGRSDRLGRAADFSSSNNNMNSNNAMGNNYPRHDRFGPRRSTIEDTEENEAEAAFQLVDTTKATTTRRFVNPASKRRQQSQRLRQINARRNNNNNQSSGFDKMTRRHKGRYGGGRYNYNPRVDRQPSVTVQSDWKLMEDIDLAKLNKNLTTSTTVPPDPEDVYTCGFLDPYNDAYDKVTARQPVPLKRMEHKIFYPVTTTDDPVMEKLAVDGAANIFITDTILSHLMTCTRSVYPWDVVVQKLPNGTLFFDKRDQSQFDFLTVSETAYQAPSQEEGPERLALEATVINQNFSQQILKKSGRHHMELPNPFFDPDEDVGQEPASVAFRYRKFQLDDEGTTLICRTELHGLVKQQTQYMTAYCLNEYNSSNNSTSNNNNNNNTNHSNTTSWRDKIDAQRGAVLAHELKNNSFKIAKWTAQSILAGAHHMKLGFVSRASPKVPSEHVVLATQFYRPADFATQQGLQEGVMWSIFRMFVALLEKVEPGKYVIVRNPNKALMHLYQVPQDAFEEEEDEDGEDED